MSNEYVTWGTLFLVVAKYVLDFVAPRTKNKTDDKAKKVLDALPLPTLPAAAEKVLPASGQPVRGFGVARDHR